MGELEDQLRNALDTVDNLRAEAKVLRFKCAEAVADKLVLRMALRLFSNEALWRKDLPGWACWGWEGTPPWVYAQRALGEGCWKSEAAVPVGGAGGSVGGPPG